jgi:hypothetical protein
MDTLKRYVPGFAALRRTLAVLSALSLTGIADATPLPFQSLLVGGHSAITHTAIFLVGNEEEWQALWAAHSGTDTPAPPRPEVDFTHYTVIAFFAGTRGHLDHSVRIRKVDRLGGPLHLVVEQTFPAGPDCILLPATSEPYEMVLISNSTFVREVDFELNLKPQPCSP